MKISNFMQTISSSTNVLAFGKYKDKTVEWILDNDPGYIVWLDENSVVAVSDDILSAAFELEIESNDFRCDVRASCVGITI